MKGERVIITGSSGLIGSAFIDRIGERFQEFGFDRQGPPHPPPSTDHVIDCDLSSEESVEHVVASAPGAASVPVWHLMSR